MRYLRVFLIVTLPVWVCLAIGSLPIFFLMKDDAPGTILLSVLVSYAVVGAIHLLKVAQKN